MIGISCYTDSGQAENSNNILSVKYHISIVLRGHTTVHCVSQIIRYDTIEEFNVDSKAEYSA